MAILIGQESTPAFKLGDVNAPWAGPGHLNLSFQIERTG